ncbi:MAG: translation initiation factor IF-2 [Candidatus Magasanikbacteria bacterium]|nr:translation initiation factor IF-2 [Candidatus Magasanikbacteria bacterium]
MNVTELARRLRVRPQQLLEILPEYGFDVGRKAVKVDDKVAFQVMRSWKNIKRDIDDKRRKEAEEKIRLEKALRKESGLSAVLPEVMTVKSFSESLNMPVTQVIVELMKNGILANQNQNIDYDTAAIMAEELGFSVQKEESGKGVQEKEEEKTKILEEALENAKNKESRPPVVVVMGHVDHGKTKLLDTIRKANIISGESGGITQHIGAYQTIWKDPKTKEERPLTFIDTPGHEAFTIMRSRGAQVADMAILVVAADDGVKPQTKEAIQIIKAANLPYIVALNKIDKDTVDIDRVKTELSKNDVIPEDWGGDVPIVPISALANTNIDKLLDILLLTADVNEDKIQADPNVAAVGTVIESHLDKNIGAVATILIQAGTLKKGEPLVIGGEIYGKVRAMKDYDGNDLKEASPSTPVQIIGFKVAPVVGDVLNNTNASSAKKIDVKRKKLEQTGAQQTSISSDSGNEDDDNKKKYLNLVIKADVLGSLEAIIASLEKIEHKEVGVKIVGKGLGNINESDIVKIESSGGTVIGFNVNATSSSEELMRDKDIEFLRFEIIYGLIDWVKEQLQFLLEKEKVVTEIGKLDVKAIFREEKNNSTIGGLVIDGKMRKDARVRITRGNEIKGYGELIGLQSGKQDVKMVPAGSECGLRIQTKVKIEKEDILEVFVEDTKDRELKLN